MLQAADSACSVWVRAVHTLKGCVPGRGSQAPCELFKEQRQGVTFIWPPSRPDQMGPVGLDFIGAMNFIGYYHSAHYSQRSPANSSTSDSEFCCSFLT